MLRSLIADKNLNCESQKILGVKWNDREDTLIFDLDEIAATTDTQQALTKRIMLRTLASFFDPLGMLQPIIVGLKSCSRKLAKSPRIGIKCYQMTFNRNGLLLFY